MTQLLQNINRVEFIDPRYLNGIVLMSDSEVSLQYRRNFIELDIVGLASIEVSQTTENGSRLSTVKLMALTTTPFKVGNRRLAWRVTTITGNQYLIGINEQPFPISTVTENFPDKATEQSGTTVKVEWKTPLTLLEIIDA